jgi:uncharacterized protein with PIN domain
MVAAVCAWHPQHEQAANEIERRLELAEPMILAAPALVESYAVLTRLPPPIASRRLTRWPSSKPASWTSGGPWPWKPMRTARSCVRRPGRA